MENGLHLRAEGAGPRSNSLADRWALAKRQMGSWWSGTVQARIKELRDAREGSLKNHVFRVIQAVLSREHPAESFLKSVPTEGPVRPEGGGGGWHGERYLRQASESFLFASALACRCLWSSTTPRAPPSVSCAAACDSWRVGGGTTLACGRSSPWALSSSGAAGHRACPAPRLCRARPLRHAPHPCQGILLPPLHRSPLLLLPIPLSNFPVFFFVYRLQSHHQALAGARQLQAAFAAYDAAEGRDMRDRALFGEEAGRDGGATTRGADGPAGPSGSVSNAGVSGDGVSGAGVPWAGPPVPGAVFYEAVHRNAVFQNAMGASRAEVPGGGEGVGSGAGPREESAGGGSAWAAATAGLGRVAGMAAEVSGVGPRLSQGVASVGEYVDAAWARVRAVDHERRRVLRSLQGARRAVEARIEALMHRGRGDDAGGAGAVRGVRHRRWVGGVAGLGCRMVPKRVRSLHAAHGRLGL